MEKGLTNADMQKLAYQANVKRFGGKAAYRKVLAERSRKYWASEEGQKRKLEMSKK